MVQSQETKSPYQMMRLEAVDKIVGSFTGKRFRDASRYTSKKNIAQAFILERYFFVSICPAAIPDTCLSVFLAAVLLLC